MRQNGRIPFMDEWWCKSVYFCPICGKKKGYTDRHRIKNRKGKRLANFYCVNCDEFMLIDFKVMKR